MSNEVLLGAVNTDVRRGMSGTSRDVPIFVQFHKKFVHLMTNTEKKKVAKKIADLEKNIKKGRQTRPSRPTMRPWAYKAHEAHV